MMITLHLLPVLICKLVNQTQWLNLNLKDHSMFHMLIQEPKDLPPLFNIAQTSMTDSPLPMVRPELSHTHKQDSTAELTMDLPKMMDLKHFTFHTNTQEPKDLPPLSNIAQTSMTDSLSPMERLELSHTHNPDSTAEPTTDLHKPKQKDHFTFHTSTQEPKDLPLLSNIAQISMTDSH